MAIIIISCFLFIHFVEVFLSCTFLSKIFFTNDESAAGHVAPCVQKACKVYKSRILRPCYPWQ